MDLFKRRTFLLVMLLSFAFGLLAPAVLVYAGVEPPPIPTTQDFSWQLVAAQAITALTPVVVYLLIYGTRKLMPKIPRIVLPLLSLALGPLVTYVSALATNTPPTSVIQAAALGALAVFIRELVTTLGEHGFSA